MSENEPTHAIAVLEHVITALVAYPDEVEVETEARDDRVELHVTVAKSDMGRVIGKRGRVANAIRTVVAAAAVRDGVAVEVEFVD